MSKVAFRACCAHQSSDGARVTAACMILRLFRSRKNRTKIGRKSTSKVCTKSQAQVTWLRRKVLQRWPSPGTPFFMRSEEHTSELQSRLHLVCRLLLEKKKKNQRQALRPTHRPSRSGRPHTRHARR